MNISEVIRRLEELRAAHGDLNVRVCTGEGMIAVDYIERNVALPEPRTQPHQKDFEGWDTIVIGAESD